MKINELPREGSYAAMLNEEQRIELYGLLLSGVTLAEAREKAPPWPDGPEKGRKPSEPCLWRIKRRLRIEERVQKIQIATATFRATQGLLQNLVNKTDQEKVLDQAVSLIAQQVIDAALDLNGPSAKTAAAWLLLRRADQRRSDKRTAIVEAQAAKTAPEPAPTKPVLSDEEKERRWRQIFGLQPRQTQLPQ